eukprot:g14456.t1
MSRGSTISNSSGPSAGTNSCSPSQLPTPQASPPGSSSGSTVCLNMGRGGGRRRAPHREKFRSADGTVVAKVDADPLQRLAAAAGGDAGEGASLRTIDARTATPSAALDATTALASAAEQDLDPTTAFLLQQQQQRGMIQMLQANCHQAPRSYSLPIGGANAKGAAAPPGANTSTSSSKAEEQASAGEMNKTPARDSDSHVADHHGPGGVNIPSEQLLSLVDLADGVLGRDVGGRGRGEIGQRNDPRGAAAGPNLHTWPPQQTYEGGTVTTRWPFNTAPPAPYNNYLRPAEKGPAPVSPGSPFASGENIFSSTSPFASQIQRLLRMAQKNLLQSGAGAHPLLQQLGQGEPQWQQEDVTLVGPPGPGRNNDNPELGGGAAPEEQRPVEFELAERLSTISERGLQDADHQLEPKTSFHSRAASSGIISPPSPTTTAAAEAHQLRRVPSDETFNFDDLLDGGSERSAGSGSVGDRLSVGERSSRRGPPSTLAYSASTYTYRTSEEVVDPQEQMERLLAAEELLGGVVVGGVGAGANSSNTPGWQTAPSSQGGVSSGGAASSVGGGGEGGTGPGERLLSPRPASAISPVVVPFGGVYGGAASSSSSASQGPREQGAASPFNVFTPGSTTLTGAGPPASGPLSVEQNRPSFQDLDRVSPAWEAPFLSPRMPPRAVDLEDIGSDSRRSFSDQDTAWSRSRSGGGSMEAGGGGGSDTGGGGAALEAPVPRPPPAAGGGPGALWPQEVMRMRVPRDQSGGGAADTEAAPTRTVDDS